MIKVKITKKEKIYQKINIMGHAMYDDFGKDIVCSAASSIVITTINGILSLDQESLLYKIDQKGMKIEVKSKDPITQKLIGNMIHMLEELQENYQDYIEIK